MTADRPARSPERGNEPNVAIADNPAESRFEISVDGALAGFAEYHDGHSGRAFTHTEVAAEYEGMGLASQLIRYALDEARAAGRKVLPVCPFVHRASPRLPRPRRRPAALRPGSLAEVGLRLVSVVEVHAEFAGLAIVHVERVAHLAVIAGLGLGVAQRLDAILVASGVAAVDVGGAVVVVVEVCGVDPCHPPSMAWLVPVAAACANCGL